VLRLIQIRLAKANLEEISPVRQVNSLEDVRITDSSSRSAGQLFVSARGA
jgi:hypothetical protein